MTVIQWPAIIKLSQCDELLYIADAQQYQEYMDEHLHYQEDILIDSLGYSHRLKSNMTAAPQTHSPIDLGDFIRLVQLYAQSLRQCCSAKISFDSLTQGLAVVRYLNEQDT